MPHVVAIQEHCQLAPLRQSVLQRACHRALAAAAQPCMQATVLLLLSAQPCMHTITISFLPLLHALPARRSARGCIQAKDTSAKHLLL